MIRLIPMERNFPQRESIAIDPPRHFNHTLGQMPESMCISAQVTR